MTPNHHPLPETLISYASGALPNSAFTLIACHLAMCPTCVRDIRRLELIGGILMSRFDAPPASRSVAQGALARLSAGFRSSATAHGAKTRPDDQLLPSLLIRNLPIGDDMSWQGISPGVRQIQVVLPKGSGQMRLLRLTPGNLFSKRLHGAEAGLALVLQGVLTHESGDLVRGDVIEWTGDDGQDARATGDVDCVCLIATTENATAKPNSALVRLRNGAGPLVLRVGRALHNSAPLAAGLALLIGIGIGSMVPKTPETDTIANLVQVEGNRLVAQGALEEALNTLPSGRESVASLDGGDVRLDIRMSFEEQSGRYCRQYRIVASPPEQYSGIACRTGGDWTVRMQALLPPSASGSEQTIPADAGANAAMDAVIGAWISGNPLVGDEEADLMRRGWKK